MWRQPLRQPPPPQYGGVAPYPQNPSFINPNFPSNPQYHNQQQFFQNPFFQNPNFQVHQNVNSVHRVSIEVVEKAVVKAHRDLVTAGEHCNAWKVSQAALISLQVDSWNSLGIQIQDVGFLRKLLFTEGKVNAFIHCFVGAQKITTLYDLETAICKNESVERFEELGLGPLSRHPLAHHYFLIPSDLMEVLKISSEDVITCLHSFMEKSNKRTISAEELLPFIADQKSVPRKEQLGVRIHSLGMHIACIRQATKSERTILNKSLELIKNKTGKAQPPPTACAYLEKQMLVERFDCISDRVKSFSSIYNMSTGKHIRFDYSSSNDDTDESDDNVDNTYTNTDPHSSCTNAINQSCPYPSAAEEMKRLGLKFNSGEKSNSSKDKIMDFRGSRSSGKKQKRKRREQHGNIMKKYQKQDGTLKKCQEKEKVTMIDLAKEKDFLAFPEANLETFVTTWKEACCKHSAIEVLDLMINFYMSHISERKKKNVRKIFSSHPGVGLIYVAVTSIRRGLLDSVYDTIQIFGDHGSGLSAQSAKMIEIKDSVKEDSVSNYKDTKMTGHGIAVEDIIGRITEFFRLNTFKSKNKDLSSRKLFKVMKKFSDCETWLATQYSVTKFSSLGYGNFFAFLKHHASLLPEDLHDFLQVKSPEPSGVEVCMLHHQLELLLAQTESNRINEEVSKSYVSQILNRQFPTTSFQIVGNEPDKFFSNLIKSQKDHGNSSCILYSMSLLGNQLPRTSQEAFSRDDVLSKDAIDCLRKVPMLSDLISWSHWDAIYANSLGPLSDWLLNQVNTKELLCVATMDGKFIRIDQSATVDEFLEAMIQLSPFQVALKLLSLLALHGGVSSAPVSLLKCYVQRAIDVIISNHDTISKASTYSSRFILKCLEHLPSEFRNFGYNILVSGFRSVVKDAHSVILQECRQIDQSIMLHDIGLSLGIGEWIDDLHKFGSSAACDLLISSKALSKTLPCSSSGAILIHTETQKSFRVDCDMSPTINEKMDDDDKTKRNESILVNGNCDFEENTTVKDATSFVESIRRDEFGLDSTLNGFESSIVKKQHARLGRALHCLSQELYSQDSHLLLELVQNADDNIYPEEVDPTLVFILQESGIVVLNNEQGFSAQNIRALCDIGNSTKKGSSAGYIGQKGIGFKSVFRVTDAPEIHSNGFHVKFDITEGQIGFVLPTVITPCNVKIFSQLLSEEKNLNADTKWNTCIVLPFRSKSRDVIGMTSIITMFSDLHPSLLLFLHRLRCIKFVNMVDNTLVNMRREILGDGIVKVSHGQDTMTWLVIRKKLPANLIRPDVHSTEIALAFTLQENESSEYKPHLSPQPVFAFLPLRNYGLKFILQGDFVLPSSREEVDGNSAWNQWLLSEFPALFVSAEQSFCLLPCFIKCPGKAVTIYMSFVPIIGDVHGFFSHLPQMIISKLRTSNCLILDDPDSTWVLPCKVLRGWNEQARLLISDDLLQRHIGLGYLNRDIELSDAIAKTLGVQEYGPKVLIDVIQSICRSKDGLLSLGLDWISAWLSSLHSAISINSRMENDLTNSLRKIPFIPLSDGSFSSVADGPIWLPCDSSSVGIEGKYNATEFPNLYAKLRTVNPFLLSASANNLYSLEDIKRDSLIHILNKIGVQQLSAHEIIKSHILWALSNDKCMENKKLSIEYLSFILLHLQYECPGCFSDRKDMLAELRKNPVILTNHGYKSPADDAIHFGKEYKNPVDMDKLISNVDYKWLEVDTAYLTHPSVQSLSFGVMKWREFFQELGVTDFVQVTCIKKGASDSAYDDWESTELLNFLSTFSSNKCREKSIYLLEVLDKMWDDFYNAYSGRNISNINEGKSDCKSLFMKSLCEYRWIASSMDHDLHQPRDLFYDCDEVRSVLGNLAPYAIPKVTSKYLWMDIGFKTKVSLDDGLKILRFWKESKSPCKSSILQMSEFYTFISEEFTRSNAKIVEEFKSSSYIFTPYLCASTHNDIMSGTFLSPKELFWHDPTGCVDKTKELFVHSTFENNNFVPCKELSTVYPGLHDFFLNVCGVPKNPSFSNYLQILLQLSSTVPPSQSAHMVFQVFIKWADDLRSGSIDPCEIYELKENLLKLEYTMLPTLQDKWVSLHPSFGLICWPDDDELKQQFKHYGGLDFLHFGEVSKEEQEKFFDRVATFMHEMGVPALSEVVSREAIYYGTHDNREKASIINWILPYAQRYLYKLYPEIYANMKQNGAEKFNQLQVIVVDELYYKNCLKGRGNTSKKRYECSCLLQGNTLYTTSAADSHSIFLELSRIFFRGSTELQFANFLHMITTMAESGSSSEQTEFFILNSQKIPMLPSEEPIWLFSSLMDIPNNENSQSIPLPMNIVQNISTTQIKPGVSKNWPPTGWKTAPDVFYAKANYHLTRPCVPLDNIPLSEELLIPAEINEEYAIGESSIAATVTNPDLDPSFKTKKEVSVLERDALRFETHFDENQLKKTGQLGEAVAYKYFVDKLGAENVKWVNEGNETGLPYDLVIGVDENSKEYIEVKATRSAKKDWFDISTREWQFANEKGDSYTVAHVLLGHNKASVTILKNPLRLCQQNLLNLALLMSRQVKE